MRSRVISIIVALLFSVFPIFSYSYYYDEDATDSGYSSSSYDNDDYDSPREYSYYQEHRYRQQQQYQYRRGYSGRYYYDDNYRQQRYRTRYGARRIDSGPPAAMPSQINSHGERVIVVNPRIHAWGAYSPEGTLLRSGTATAGNSYCRDIRRSCRTKVGTFRIYTLGSSSCRSHKYPLPRGGAPMPYCMFFNGGQGLHGSYEVVRGNVSHGCVRLHVPDAEWIRFNFARIGTKVIVMPY